MQPQPEVINEVYCREVLEAREKAIVRELDALVRRPRRESIHDTRVQSRRTRAALEAFQDLFPPRPWLALYKRIRRITRTLGRPREIEVCLALLQDLTRRGDMAENICREYLEEDFRKVLTRRIQRAKKKLRGVTPSVLQRQMNFLVAGLSPADEWSSLSHRKPRGLVGGSFTNQARRQPALFELKESLTERRSRVLKELAVPVLSFGARDRFRKARDTELHKLRIATKKLRYATEIFDPAWPGGLGAQIALAHDLQDAGGRYQDLCVLRERIRKQLRRLTRRKTTHLAFQMGRLLSQVEDRRTALRKDILPALLRFQAALREMLPDVDSGDGRKRRPSTAAPKKRIAQPVRARSLLTG